MSVPKVIGSNQVCKNMKVAYSYILIEQFFPLVTRDVRFWSELVLKHARWCLINDTKGDEA